MIATTIATITNMALPLVNIFPLRPLLARRSSPKRIARAADATRRLCEPAGRLRALSVEVTECDVRTAKLRGQRRTLPTRPVTDLTRTQPWVAAWVNPRPTADAGEPANGERPWR